MRNTVRLRPTQSLLPLNILLVTACLKWLFEGVLDMPILEAGCLGVGLVYLLMQRKVRISKLSLPWLLFIFNIAFSLLIHGSLIRAWGRGLIFIFMTAYVLFYNLEVGRYTKIMRFLVVLGLIVSGLVLMHYVLGSTFTNLYFPRLNSTARDLAERYNAKGYNFGLMYNPHEPAGLIAFAIMAFVLRKQLGRSRKTRYYYLIAAVLLFLLLLTGKRAILVILALSLTFTILLLYGSRKQIVRSLALVFGLLIAAGSFLAIAMSNPDVPLFNRVNSLVQSFIAGSAFDDSGRMVLYVHAFEEWKENWLFGIGWKTFSGLTTTKFKLYRPHEVNCDYLQWLCETGIVGFILNIIPVSVMGYRAAIVGRRLIKQYHTADEQWVLLMAVCIQIFTLVYAFVEIPFYDIVFFSVYILSCIVINSAYVRRNNRL